MKNVVPFRSPAKFAEFGIDWTLAARIETERRLREAFLTYETSCGPNGLVSILAPTKLKCLRRSNTPFRRNSEDVGISLGD